LLAKETPVKAIRLLVLVGLAAFAAPAWAQTSTNCTTSHDYGVGSTTNCTSTGGTSAQSAAADNNQAVANFNQSMANLAESRRRNMELGMQMQDFAQRNGCTWYKAHWYSSPQCVPTQSKLPRISDDEQRRLNAMKAKQEAQPLPEGATLEPIQAKQPSCPPEFLVCRRN
jgi:hypothetical protein